MTQWTSIGPQPTTPSAGDPFSGYPTDAGRVTALAIDPADPTGNTIYLGAAEGGVWVTTDGGQSWTPLTDFQVSLAVGSIALDATTIPTTIYVGTGEENFNGDAYYGAGILKSTDGGKTWTQDATFSQPTDSTPAASGPFIGSIAVDPTNSKILLAAVQGSPFFSIGSGIWQSVDAGLHWINVLSQFSPGAGTSVVFDPNSPGTAYAALGYFAGDTGNGVYKSTDSGTTWTLISPGGTSGMGRATLTLGPPVAAGKPSELVAAIADASACNSNPNACSANLLQGLFLSTDGGTSWTNLAGTPDFCGDPNDVSQGFCFYDLAVAVSPKDPNVIYVGGTNSLGGKTLAVTTDGGFTWSKDLYAGNNGSAVNSAGQLHTDTHVIVFSSDGKKLYIGDDGGVWETGNVGVTSGITWNGLNNSLSLTQFYPGISTSSMNILTLGGTQDNDTQLFSGDLGWMETGFCGDGGYTAISGIIWYVACAGNEGVWSTEQGVSSRWAGNGIGTCTTTIPSSNCYNANFVPPLVVDPTNSENLYFGTNVVYQSSDGAFSWQAISPDLALGDSQQFGTFITTLNVSPVDSKIVYAGTADARVWVTLNAGAGSGGFQEVDTNLPLRYVTEVVADPVGRTTAYVAFSGFSSCVGCDGLGHIFETQNNGQSWTNITGNLPDVPVNALVVDPAFAATLYAATDIGVFSTSNGGVTWSPLGTGLPLVAVLGLTMDSQRRTLLAGSHGRGMWALQLGRPPDFFLSANVLTSSVNAGTSATFTINLLPLSGPFANAISLACSGLPALASCSFSPSSVTPGSAAATSTLTISTTAPVAATEVQRKPWDFPGTFFIWLGSVLALLAATIAAKRAVKKTAAAFTFSALVICAGATLMACGGGGTNHTSAQPGTPVGTYTITVTGSSNQLQHSVTIQLSVV